MRPISEDLRQRIVTARTRGESAQTIAQRYELSKRTVERVWSRFQATGNYASYKKGKPSRSRLDPHKASVLVWIEREPGLTLEQLCQRLESQCGVKISIPGLWFQLKKYGLSFKKNARGQ